MRFHPESQNSQLIVPIIKPVPKVYCTEHDYTGRHLSSGIEATHASFQGVRNVHNKVLHMWNYSIVRLEKVRYGPPQP